MLYFRTKIISCLFQVIILLVFPYTVISQPVTGTKKTFKEAESHYLFGEYELALPLYLSLNKPDNYNIQYKLGTCYLNIDGEKEKAIPFLENSVKHSSYDARVNSFREKRAPLDSYFFLGKSYLVDNQIEKALDTFLYFKKIGAETKDKGGMKNLVYVDQMIRACETAPSYREAPYSISKRLLEKKFSNGPFNENPAVSFDGNTIVYTEREDLENKILFSKRVNGKWLPPVEINSQLKSGKDCSSCSLNSNGTLLFLYKTDNFDGNIFFSEFINNSWTAIRKLNGNVNTRYYESHAAVSPDGKKLFFTSNREGGMGGLDIYVSERDGSGDWGPAVNLGTSVNTTFNEDTPFITLNDSILYFCSEGHNGMGGYDIFRSRKSGTSWESPQNLGYPLNSTDDDRFFQPFNNDENGFYSIFTDKKKKEIFYITLTNERLNRVFEIKGNYRLKDTVVPYDEKNSIYLVDNTSGDTLDTSFPESKSGDYNFIVAPGHYKLLYTGPGYYSQTLDTAVMKDNPSRIIEMKDIILDTHPLAARTLVYEKLDLSQIREIPEVDPDNLIDNVRVLDVSDNDVSDTTILYYTVQVMALYNPVDISFFKYVSDIKALHNDNDLFYRYITGWFNNKEEAYAYREDLIKKGYPDDLFVKKVTRIPKTEQIPGKKYYTIQIKAVSKQLDMETAFAGLNVVRETKETDGFYHYLYGRYTSQVEAETVLERVKAMGFTDAFVREISIIIEK